MTQSDIRKYSELSLDKYRRDLKYLPSLNVNLRELKPRHKSVFLVVKVSGFILHDKMIVLSFVSLSEGLCVQQRTESDHVITDSISLLQ